LLFQHLWFWTIPIRRESGRSLGNF
jgi:hypothetical protein